MADLLIAAVIAAYVIYVAVKKIKKAKNGECCCGCESCGAACKSKRKKDRK